jgi:MscS family membrane protein
MRSVLLCLLAFMLCSAEGSSPPVTLEQSVIPALAESPLAPVKTDSPRDTLRSFMLAMDHHVQSLNRRDGKAEAWLEDAIRCLDLSQANVVGRDIIGREAARNLKEVIDRVITIDYDKVPATADQQRWRLRGTEIAIHRVTSGDRNDEFLFTPETVLRAKDYFLKIKDMPLQPGALGGGFHSPWQEQYIPQSLLPEVFGIAYWQWLALGLLIFVGLVMRMFSRIGGYLVKRATLRTEVTWDDELVEAMVGPITHLSTTGVWFASLHLLGITGTAYTVIAFLIKGAFFINLAYLAYNFAGFLGTVTERRVQKKHQDINQGLLRLLKQTLQLLALVFCLLLGAQNMGMDVASLIAGLGIGGLAFALAAKDTLANLFGSIMIMIDRPFRIGDFIIAKGTEGTVEVIGFRCTRVRTLANSLVSIPNSELVLANIDNLGMREHRRVRETYGLEYGTPPERIEAFCAGVRAILAANPVVKQGAFEVWFTNLGSSSLDVLVNYHLSVSSWSAELENRQAILLQVLRLAEQVQVSFAFPTQTLHVATLPAQPAKA